MISAILKTMILSLLFLGCYNNDNGQYKYRQPENINDGFDVGTLDEVNIDTDLISRGVDRILGGRYKEVHSMLIYRDGKLVFEEYFQGHKYQWDAPDHHSEWVTWNRSMPHCAHSVTKSITSTCIGIAIDKGFIRMYISPFLNICRNINTLKLMVKKKSQLNIC